jgi:DNA (cytosine-5)-methyltransferase 1
MSAKPKLKYISLFSGCGGFDIGFKENGFTCLGAYDINPHVLNVHSKNLDSPVYNHDLVSIDLPGRLPKTIDVIVAGSPCQGFSTIGKRDINDPRNLLLLAGGQIAIKYNASVFVCENVPGSMSGEHKKYWAKLEQLLTKSGYQTKLIKYDASELGVPQTRKRLIFYAWKSDKATEIKFPKPIGEKVLLKDILDIKNNVANHNLDYIADQNDLMIASRIQQGQKLCNVRGGERSVHTWDIPEVFGETSSSEVQMLKLLMKLRRQIRKRQNGDADPVEISELKKHFNGNTRTLVKNLLNKGYIKKVENTQIDLTNTFNGKYKRLDLNSLSPTVDTRFGSYKHFIHPIEHRSLSVREAARIQGFNDNFVFSGPIQKQYEMIGNAVPPPLARFVAQTIKQIILPVL